MARPVSAPPLDRECTLPRATRRAPRRRRRRAGALRKRHFDHAVAPKRGRLEEAEQHHQSHAIVECMFMIPEVFDLLDELVDERKHTCGQPGGVQWGTGLRH